MAKRAWEASSSGDRWLPKVLPKHTIFLSHSGHDKPFVERLCEELKRLKYTPFFDQNRDNLPRGETFSPHLFKAAEQCLLAVIVLSEGYLTSKWPMLELATFVKAMETTNPNMKLLPLFYKVSPSNIVPEKWIESWKKLAEDGRIDAEEIDFWSKAVKVLMKAKNVETKRMKSMREHYEIMPDDYSELLSDVVRGLRPFNGLEFREYGPFEGRYIQAVVDEICEIVPPMMKYSMDGMRGYQRICERVSSLFEEGILTNYVCKPGCLYLGLYGMGGVGKTTLCEAMCNFYQVKFRGRVCHVELQSDTKHDERLKHVIRQIGGLDDWVVETIYPESRGLKSLQGRLKSQPVFLAVDNVGDSQSSRDEALRFITLGLACGSKVMVTSRSRLILESVLMEAKYCKPIPRLEEQEAEELFRSVAIPQKLLSPLQPGEAMIVKACVQECQFLDDGYVVEQYHPLVLKALGAFYHDVDKDDIMQWEEASKVKKKLQASREFTHVKNILGLDYGTLSDRQKLLFLDVVFLFNDDKYLSVLLSDWLSTSWDDKVKWAISMIAAMHGIPTFEVEMEVEELQRKSLIYESGPTLRVHDLYIEFARSVISVEGSKEREWWVGHRDANGYNLGLTRLVLVEDKSKICQPPPQLWKCPNLECLIMWHCEGTLQPKLDLECFPNLRVFVICVDDIDYDPSKKEMEILCTSGNEVGNRGCLPELRSVVLCGFDIRRIPFLRQCRNLTFLSINNCDFDSLDFIQVGTSLFENLMALETLVLWSGPSIQFRSSVVDGILQGASKLMKLKFLEIGLGLAIEDEDGSCKLDLSPLRSLTSLKTLSLPHLPSCIRELGGLDELSQLIKLNLENGRGLEKLPNIDLLPNLRQICVEGCWSLILEDQLRPRF